MDARLRPDLEFWTHLIANGDHSEKCERFGHMLFMPGSGHDDVHDGGDDGDDNNL